MFNDDSDLKGWLITLFYLFAIGSLLAGDKGVAFLMFFVTTMAAIIVSEND